MKYLFTILLVAISATTFAQGNLQFHKVVNVSGAIPLGNNVSTTVTVPVGKVWKITSSSWFNGSTGSSIANYNLCIGAHALFGRINSEQFTFLPVWLEEDDYDIKICGTQVNLSSFGAVPIDYAISGIESNIVP